MQLSASRFAIGERRAVSGEPLLNLFFKAFMDFLLDNSRSN